MTRKPEGALRRGWTTGACATAAVKAAYMALLSGDFPDPVSISLPKGEQPAFALARQSLTEQTASAAIVKDAGDDPDVTHLATIQATVRRGAPLSGVVFRAGPGVGTVTMPGLPLAVGEPAINPVPRRMMQQVVAEVAKELHATGDVEIELSVDDGEALARQTWNPRLGIVGGLSILGTTGIVVPFSCSAWIHSIHRGIDVACAAGLTHAAASTGSTSEAAVQKLYGLPATALLDMGDFAGGLLKYLRRHPLPRLTLAGGFGKLCKLAAGHLDLHSGRSQVDFELLAALLEELGAVPALVSQARSANTAKQVLDMATAAELPLGDLVAARAREVALNLLDGESELEVLIFDRAGQLVGKAAGWRT